MNKSRQALLWLILPLVLIVGYFVFQPSQDDESPVVATQDAVIDSGASQTDVREPGQNDLANEAEQSAPSSAQELERDLAFINYAFPLLSKWDLQEVKPLLAQETIAASSDETLNGVMSVLEDRLGELKSFETPRPVTPSAGELAQDAAFEGKLQHYQFVAYYEAGKAEVDLILDKRQDTSALYSFDIHVPKQQDIF
jgi:hypothetical protein